MENNNKKLNSGASVQDSSINQKAKTAEDSSHEKHVHAGQKGVEACCKKMGSESICCRKK